MHIALDIATKTGWAIWKDGMSIPSFGTLRLPVDVGEVGRPMEGLRQHLADLHSVDPITHLYFEASILPGRTSAAAVFKLCALSGMAEWFGHRIGAKVRQVDQQSWRKHFVGRGTGKSAELKAAAIDACRQHGWAVSTDHEADALGCLDYGLHCMGIHTPWRDATLLRGIAA